MGGDSCEKIDAGLPNLTGYGGLIMYANRGTGVFNGSPGNNNLPGGAGAAAGDLNFNASKSSAIYGKSETVQPPSIQLLPQIKY